MRLLLAALLFAAAARAAVQPPKHARLALKLQAVSNRQTSGTGYTLAACAKDSDCKPPRFCFISKCFIGREDDKKCSSCADCPGYPSGQEVCAKDPEAGISCVDAAAAVDLNSEFGPGCDNAPTTGTGAGAFVEPEFPQAPIPDVPTPEDGSGATATPDEPQGVPLAPEEAPPAEPTASSAPTPTTSAPSTTEESSDESSSDDEASSDDDESTDAAEDEAESDDDDDSTTDSDEADDASADEAEANETDSEGAEEDDVEPSPTPICIAVEHLGHLASHELVFGAHMRARVLCDAADSCATPGHIVVFRGRPMMMRSYCDVAHGGCTERRKLVNSPRFKPKVVVPSNTDGLHFTALAARYETRLEEHALKLAVRVGL